MISNISFIRKENSILIWMTANSKKIDDLSNDQSSKLGWLPLFTKNKTYKVLIKD